MENIKLIKNDLKYILFSEIYQRYSEPKTRRKAFAVMETAVHCFDRKGFENVTFLMVAREAGLTGPSLRYYFTDLDELRLIAIQYVYLTAQKIVLTHMEKGKSPKDLLRLYLEGHYLWIYNAKTHFRVWLSFVSSASRNKKDRELNTKATLIGTKRIIEFLEAGKKSGILKHDDSLIGARFLQTFILGWLSACASQNIEDVKGFSESMISECLKKFS